MGSLQYLIQLSAEIFVLRQLKIWHIFFQGQLENDIWGQKYKLATKSLDILSTPFEIGIARKMVIVVELFPKVHNE